MTVNLGTALLQARSERGETLQVVSRAAKVSAAYLQKLETGRVRSPNPRVLARLAAALRLDYGELMELADYMAPDGVTTETHIASRHATTLTTASEGETQVVRALGARTVDATASPTNQALLDVLQQVHLELAALREGQESIAADLSDLKQR